MKFIQQRIHRNSRYSIAFLENEEKTFSSFVIEDPPRAVKIQKITGIPAGLYPLKIRMELTPLTIKHRAAYNTPGDEWFEFHIEVDRIPGFSGVYIHSGADEEDTDGCVTPGYAFDLSKPHDNQSLSRAATKDFYKIVYPLLKAGKPVFLEVRDQK